MDNMALEIRTISLCIAALQSGKPDLMKTALFKILEDRRYMIEDKSQIANLKNIPEKTSIR